MKLNPIKITSELIKCQSITPENDGAIELVSQLLSNEGFKCHTIERNGISNLFARWGNATDGLTLCFNGHTDVVPPGIVESWSHNPFSGIEKNGFIFGRGAADMKSAIAAFICAAATYLNDNKPRGSIVLAITGDEEGKAEDGTAAILDWMTEHNEKIDHCIVGEPTSKEHLGDTIKIGRRGSLTAKITAFGLQGHVAYPEKALNPLTALTKLLIRLEKRTLDKGNEFFDPSSLVITSVDTGNISNNVIPEKGEAKLNIRFNNLQTEQSLKKWLKKSIQKVINETSVHIKLDVTVSARPFISEPGEFFNIVSKSIKSATKISPSISTSGGTSDARFIQEFCPVVEFGIIGKTMHQTNENVEVDQIIQLTKIYETIINSYFN